MTTRGRLFLLCAAQSRIVPPSDGTTALLFEPVELPGRSSTAGTHPPPSATTLRSHAAPQHRPSRRARRGAAGGLEASSAPQFDPVVTIGGHQRAAAAIGNHPAVRALGGTCGGGGAARAE